ncbi:2-dehydro-3-deoxyphosphooctonate aldolase [Pustulibacterium marinum]|nr:2-dehydro-3-deoxyphosphooctonate aldolase [Pustulibacterium marinum]
MKHLFYAGIFLFLCACSSSNKQTTTLKNSTTFRLTEISKDTNYGYSEKKPVEVGGVSEQSGPMNERRYLNALAGPNGEQISYFRAGSCCPIKSNNDPFGFGSVMLDIYRVTWEGKKDTVSIYINMYDSGELKAPVGFTIKK